MFENPLGRLVCCVVFAVVFCGQAKVVTLKDGRKITGEVTKTDTAYHVKTRFGTVLCPMEDVVSIKDAAKTDGDYEQRRAKAETAEDHFKLGKWAFDKKKLDIARRELKEALKLDSKFERASLLLKRVEAEIEGKGKPPPKVQPVITRPDTGQTQLRKEWLLTDEAISKIRLEELRTYRDEQGWLLLRDKVSIQFRNKVLGRFIDLMRGRDEFENTRAEEAFRVLPKSRQVAYILDKIDRDNAAIKNDIVIGSDPLFMLGFRNQVWPIMEQHCALAPCHGGATGKGGFKLLPGSGRNPKVEYANFLILDRFSSGDYAMIDRDYPDLSLFLQYGLDRDIARKKHSDKVTFAPPFPNTKRSNYKYVYDWIESLQNVPRPDYRVDYVPPFSKKAGSKTTPDKPTTAPAKPKNSK